VNKQPQRPRGLGRGLDALMPPLRPNSEPPPASASSDRLLFMCAIEKLVPNRAQPRQHFDAAALDELAESIKLHGVLEPLIVRRIAGDDRFEIVAGERRWRASQRAALLEVPVQVREASDQLAFELALIENIQREDLNAIEFAEAVGKLSSEHGYTQESLAAALNKDRSTIANALRLLKLPQKVRAMVIQGTLSEGHARALLGVADEAALIRLADIAAAKGLSVRQTEALVRAEKAKAEGAGKEPEKKSVGVRDLEERLNRRYGTRCEVRDKNGKGEIAIRYATLDELDRILDVLFTESAR
jgi:ParB family transcriptional regulator, chromosome partitioning protein